MTCEQCNLSDTAGLIQLLLYGHSVANGAVAVVGRHLIKFFESVGHNNMAEDETRSGIFFFQGVTASGLS
jgi:hypothetical protein